MTILRVYVPAPDSSISVTIVPGSGIVGEPTGAERVLIDYEGNLYGAMNIKTYEDKVYHAADRHQQSYPTMARAWVLERELIEVGTYDYERRLLEITDQAAVDTWTAQS